MRSAPDSAREITTRLSPGPAATAPTRPTSRGSDRGTGTRLRTAGRTRRATAHEVAPARLQPQVDAQRRARGRAQLGADGPTRPRAPGQRRDGDSAL
jgi:hypothetical protein